MEKLITDPFAQTLLANRARFNAKFAEARHFKPKLRADAFAEHLRSVVAPIVEAVARESPTAATETVEALYDLSLDLIGQEFLGPTSRYPAITEGWRTLLPSLPRHIAAAPQAVISAVTNALYNLSLEPSARPGEWMKLILKLAPLCSDADALLKAGQVAAWRSGLAHYRRGALDVCRTLDEKIARAVLDIPQTNTLPVTAILDHLQINPWLNPSAITQLPIPNNQLQIVARVGAFRGFGGLFIAPPLVFPAGDHFIVTDGEGSWLLTADCFGATWHRTEAQPVDKKNTTRLAINRNGQVSVDGKPAKEFPELANSQSSAANAVTLAVTTPLSHAVTLVAIVK